MQNKIRRFFIFIVEANPNFFAEKVSANRAKNKIKTKIFVFSSEVQPNFFAEKVSDELIIFIVGTGFMPVSKQHSIY